MKEQNDEKTLQFELMSNRLPKKNNKNSILSLHWMSSASEKNEETKMMNQTLQFVLKCNQPRIKRQNHAKKFDF